MEGVLHERIIGQEEAVTALSKAIRRSRSGLKDPEAPQRLVHFPRPFGRGQNRAFKALAEFLFGTEDALITYDMSEHGVAQREPPGQVRLRAMWASTKAASLPRPFASVLIRSCCLTKSKKAHPDVFNILLQILEEGRLTDSQGRSVDFRNTVIIMTSNVGARQIAETAPLGFTPDSQKGLSDKEIKRAA